MAIGPEKRGEYTLKTYAPNLYTWSPEKSDKKAVNNPAKQNYFCNATGGSQGEDWITTYVYNLVVTDTGVQQRSAYVECDYVQ